MTDQTKEVKQRSEKRYLLIILLIAAVLRIALAIYLGQAVEPISPAYDQIFFDDVARRLLEGKGFSYTRPPWPFIQPGEPTAFISYLYTSFIAGVYWVFGANPLVLRVIQALICSLMPWQVYQFVKKLGDIRPNWEENRTSILALIAALITAGYAYFVFFSATLMTEGFYLMTVTWSILLTLDLRRRPTLKKWALWGLAVTLATLLRQVFMLIAVFLFLYVLWHNWRQVKVSHVLVAGVIAASLILPWTVRNYLVFDRFLLLNSQGGQTFWNTNHPALGTNFEGSPMFPIPTDLEHLNEAELDNALLRRGWQNVVADPGRFFLLSFDRFLEHFRFWSIPTSTPLNNIARLVSYTILLPFMVTGLVMSFKEWRRWLLLYLFILAYTGIHIISWPGPRYRLPVDVLLVIFAALPLASILTHLFPKIFTNQLTTEQ